MDVRRLLPVIAGLVALLPVQTAGASPPIRDPLQAHMLGAAAGLRATPAGSGVAPAAGRQTRLLGALPLPEGLHGDAWAHGDFAYVGT